MPSFGERCTRRSERLCHARAGADRVNALSSARSAATLMLERSPHKLDTLGVKGAQLVLWQRLSEKADAVGIPPPDVSPDAALREVLRSDGLYQVCVGTALGSYDASWL